RCQGQRSSVNGLLMGVVSDKVILPSNNDQFTRYSPDVIVYPEITTKEDSSEGCAQGTGVTDDNK
ncbi:hypothetical protein NW761_015204, partial [Fusarium oxysporum]